MKTILLTILTAMTVIRPASDVGSAGFRIGMQVYPTSYWTPMRVVEVCPGDEIVVEYDFQSTIPGWYPLQVEIWPQGPAHEIVDIQPPPAFDDVDQEGYHWYWNAFPDDQQLHTIRYTMRIVEPPAEPFVAQMPIHFFLSDWGSITVRFLTEWRAGKCYRLFISGVVSGQKGRGYD